MLSTRLVRPTTKLIRANAPDQGRASQDRDPRVGRIVGHHSGEATTSTQNHYRRLAENCTRMAAECADPEIATVMRILAADYLSSAEAIERPVGQQQQQPWSIRRDEIAAAAER
jgi:hypothetical protein